ncbi:hypothetical protein ABFX02_04G203233 [Erythranthe guttata]
MMMGVDMISKLSDDILISIISRLTVAEAVCTSILSTRWRGLHKYITRLDFSPTSKQLQAFKEEEEFRLHKVGHDNRLFEEELIRKCTSVYIGFKQWRFNSRRNSILLTLVPNNHMLERVMANREWTS